MWTTLSALSNSQSTSSASPSSGDVPRNIPMPFHPECAANFMNFMNFLRAQQAAPPSPPEPELGIGNPLLDMIDGIVENPQAPTANLIVGLGQLLGDGILNLIEGNEVTSETLSEPAGETESVNLVTDTGIIHTNYLRMVVEPSDKEDPAFVPTTETPDLTLKQLSVLDL